MPYTFIRTGTQIEEIHNTVDDPKSNTQFSNDIRTIAGEYRGLWPDTGGSANKGDTYQTQVSGTPTGQYFTALQNTTVDPVGDDLNWREVVSSSSVGLQEVTATGSATSRRLADRFADVVNVKDFGAVGDGSADDTQAFINANIAGLSVSIPSGTYRIQNWIPLTGTTIECSGIIQRFDNALYSTTSSSAAIVITNDNITIIGAEFIPQGTDPTWSGGIVIENGDNILIKRCKFNGLLWGGVYGHEVQNGSLQANDVTITKCVFDGNAHNTYLADIKNLTFSNNTSKNSQRDGLRTWRNCENHVITDNFLYDNGNAHPTQSQDGIDVFVAGFKTIITGNFIYGNDVKGIDIKFGSDQDGLGITDWKHVIANNYIYSNGDSGIQVEVSDIPTYGYVKWINIHDNHIYGNTLWGIILEGAENVSVNDNYIYDNLRDGLRAEGIAGNINVLGNTLEGNAGSGITLIDPVDYAIVKNNTCIGGSTQTSGININCSGICRDNNVGGHTTANFSGTSTAITGLRGEMVTTSINASGADVALIVPKTSSAASLNIAFNTNETGVQVQVTKRNPDGSFQATLHDSTQNYTAFVPVNLPLSTSNSTRGLLEDQIVLVSVSGGSPDAITLSMHLMT